MANLVSVERASLALGTAQVLDAISLGVGGGDRIGVVGRNGGGKTTLLRVLAGDREVDTGRVARVGGLTRVADMPAYSAPQMEEWAQLHRTAERRLYRA